jgi:acyl carrier protein
MVQEIVKNKGIDCNITVDTEIYSTGLLDSIDFLNVLLQMQKLGINVLNLKTNAFNSVGDLCESAGICKYVV